MKKLVFASCWFLLALAYLLNLGSSYAPTNGDEMVYLHIARMTSESGHLLPLQSELQNMRNTKPPLLFWQAMAAGSWGWDLGTLRLPYVLETLLTAGLVAWLTLNLSSPRTGGCHEVTGGWAVWRKSVNRGNNRLLPALRVRPPFGGRKKDNLSAWGAGLLAAALYLGFFATYRYGRPVLSSSIESLFLFGVCALAIVKLPTWKAYPVRLAAVLGVLMIPALLSKSFVLAAPVGLWLFLSLWMIQRQTRSSSFGLSLSKAALPAALAVTIGVAGFALWFAVDPNPAAVWREFIIAENFATKFGDARSDSIIGFWLSPLVNAGLLFALLIGMGIAALQAMRHKALGMSTQEKILWLWVISWMLVFTLPSQRSGRYIIPAMPALAVLLAIYADRIHRVWWLLTLALIASAAAALGWVAYSLNTVFPVGLGFSPFYFAAVGVLLLVCFVALLSARFRVMLTAASAVAWLALLGALTAPFDRGLGRFDTRVTQVVAGQKMMVPQNFNAQFERFQFALTTVPRVQPLPYMASESITAESLLQQAPFAVIIRPLGVPKPAADARSYSILATRLTLRGRQNPSEITWDSLTDAKALAHLLVEREVLIGTKN